MAYRLCHMDDIPEGGSRGFNANGTKLFGVKRFGHIHLYLNRCPHLALPLEWEPDRFLDEGGEFIRCANHGALFLRETGECVQGPCRGEQLWEIEHYLEQGHVLIGDEELPEAGAPG